MNPSKCAPLYEEMDMGKSDLKDTIDKMTRSILDNPDHEVMERFIKNMAALRKTVEAEHRRVYGP